MIVIVNDRERVNRCARQKNFRLRHRAREKISREALRAAHCASLAHDRCFSTTNHERASLDAWAYCVHASCFALPTHHPRGSVAKKDWRSPSIKD
jgi:hypothetical protein